MPDLSEFIAFVSEKSSMKNGSLVEKDILIHKILKTIYSSGHFAENYVPSKENYSPLDRQRNLMRFSRELPNCSALSRIAYEQSSTLKTYFAPSNRLI